MKEFVTLEVKESVSPYGEMMKLLKEYIDQIDTITYCDALPDEGEADHLYIVRTGEAYIWEDEWIQLTGSGGTSGITGINVNGTPQEVIDHVVDLLIKTSDLENDSGYITDDALEGYAKETDIPTKTSDLDNDSGFITDAALDGYAKTEDIPTELSDLKNDMGYITEDALDGYALEDEIPTKVSQLENDADYTTVEATKAEIAEQIAEIVAGAPESLDTLKEIADWIEHHEDDAAAMNTAIKEAQETADNALTEAETAKDSIPTKVSELENDEGYITDSALDGYAKEDDIPTKVSELTNDSGFITEDSLEDYAKESYVDAEVGNVQEAVDALKDSAITGITVNGTAQPVEDNIAELTIEEGGGAIEHIAVNGEEQEIVDKTVDLSIDRASVDGETLVVGDTAGGGQDSRIVSGTLARGESVTFTGTMVVIHGISYDAPTTAICANGSCRCVGDDPNWLDIMGDGNSYTMESDTNYTIYYIAIIMEG